MIEFFSQNDLLLKTLMIYIVFGLSVQVVLRAGVFSLASAGFWGICAYTTAILAKTMPVPLAFISGVVLSLVASVVLALILTRLRGLYLGMGTIAFNLLVVSVALNWTDVTGGPAGLYGIPMVMTFPVALVVTLLCIGAVALWHSKAGGRFADALRTDEPLAKSMGIDTFRVRVGTFMFSAVLGAVSGAMSSLTFGVLGPTDSGFSLVVLGLTIVVIGGSSSWLGAVVGAAIVTLLPRVLTFMSEWSELVYGVLVVVMVIFAPRGLLGIAHDSTWKLKNRYGKAKPTVDATASPQSAEAEKGV